MAEGSRSRGAANGESESALHGAAWAGEVDLSASLVAKEADPNWQDSIDAVRYLVSVGARTDIAVQSGLTPLHWAASHGNAETVRILVAAGADCNATDARGRRPVDLARRYRNAETAEVLGFVDNERPTNVDPRCS